MYRKPSVKLEPKEGSKEPERGRLETSSNTDIQVEATTVEGNAARYNSSLDMTLKGFTLSKTFSYMSSKPSVDLKPGGTSQSPETMEPEVTLTTEKSPLEISSTNDIQEEATKVNSGDMQNMHVEDSVSGNMESVLGGAAARYNSALDMTLKALVSINVLKQDIKNNKQPFKDNQEEALQSLFTAVVSEEIKTEGVYSLVLRYLLVSLEDVNSMLNQSRVILLRYLLPSLSLGIAGKIQKEKAW
ncbi:unnamed protein product [Eruca vesicaria subsp. sativa]|uniref:Uncharacterized protein n=1 Tax=Eruca vesicaria subsp. sativa TaxID=29727 RepID=A0ABC8KYF4_ERUVS|nr:unnamed protein product [Eruca vesicaria subsp. sativa]